MKKILFLVLVPVLMAVLIQCVSVPQKWPGYERRAEDRMLSLQQGIGDGLASGQLTPNEAQNLLARLQDVRREYAVLRDRMTTAEEWDPLLGRLDDLERELNRMRAQPPRIDETRIEDRMIVIQRRIDEGMTSGRLTRVQGREFQLRLDSIRRDFFQRIKDRPFTPEERTDISSRLDSLEREINRYL